MLEAERYIDLFYVDEWGCSLIPVVPFGWQAAGYALNVLASRVAD